MTRPAPLQFTFPTAALGLLALCLVALACAPAGQSAGAIYDNRPTPTSTPPARLPASLDESPLLRGLVARHDKSVGQSNAGAASLTARLEWVEIRIVSRETDSASVRQFLTDRGIEYYLDPLERPGVAHREQTIGSHIPIALLKEIAELPSVQKLIFWEISPFPKIGPRLALLLLEHEVGILHQPQYGDSCGYESLDPNDDFGRHYEILPSRIDDNWNRVGDYVLMQFSIAGENLADREVNVEFAMRYLMDIGIPAEDVWDSPKDDSLTAFTKWAQFYKYEYLWLWMPIDVIHEFSQLPEIGWIGSPLPLSRDYYRCLSLQDILDLSSSQNSAPQSAKPSEGSAANHWGQNW